MVDTSPRAGNPHRPRVAKAGAAWRVTCHSCTASFPTRGWDDAMALARYHWIVSGNA
jgi:hypothetical protein